MDERVKQIEADLKTAGIEENVSTETRASADTSENTLTEFEQEQQAKGWNPDGPKSADEWARSEPLYEEIKRRGKENKQLHRALENIKSMMDKQQEIAYKRALTDLASEKNLAIQRGDVAKVQQIDQEAVNLQNSQPVVELQAVKDFKERNSDWFEGTSVDDIKMQAFARYQDGILITKNLPPEQHMQVLEEEIQKAFPNYFKPSQSSSVQSVEGGDSGVAGSRKKRHSLDSLSETQRRTAKEFARLGVMTVDKYIDELVKMGDLK